MHVYMHVPNEEHKHAKQHMQMLEHNTCRVSITWIDNYACTTLLERVSLQVIVPLSPHITA